MRELALAPAVRPRPFAFVDEQHPLRADVERFWALTAEASAPWASEPEEDGLTYRAVLRLYPGGRRLKWLNVSAQAERGGEFSSVTYHYRARKQRLAVLELPDDPLLPSLPSVGTEAAQVLQYIPRHRFTFRSRLGAGSAIGKCVRRSELEGGWLRLRAVWEAAQRAQAGFGVAKPERLDRERSVFYQSELAGSDAASRADATNVTGLLHSAGRTAAELQALDVRGIPAWRPRDLVPHVHEHAELVALFRPDAIGLVAETLELLFEHLPEDAPGTFCHGDLRCGHLLVSEREWSVIDLDGCRLGDPCQDVARLLAFLKRDVPFLRGRFAAPDGGHEELESAEAAFLAGHAERAHTPLEPGRLTWYRLAHELHFLARMFKRDLFDEVAFERSGERLVMLGDRLREELGARRRP